MNNGSGLFTDSGQVLGNHESTGVSLGDLDGDGDLDAFVKNRQSQGDRVWLNNGGVFTDTGQSLGNLTSYGVELGDLDGDGDLDAFVVNAFRNANRVWLNNGRGLFSDSGQGLGNHISFSVELGDLDGDGDLDAFVVNQGEANRVWTNNGSGQFNDSGQSLGDHGGRGVSLGDLDGDGDLDAFVANTGSQPNGIWINDGGGQFSDSGQILETGVSVKLGDLDGDGDLDAFVNDGDVGSRLWLNQNPTTLVSLSVDEATIGESAGVATFTAALSAVAAQAVTVDLSISGTATITDDYLISTTQIVIPAGETTGSVTVTSVQDSIDEPNETVIADITNVTGGIEDGTQQTTTTIVDDDLPQVPDVKLSVDNAAIAEAGGVATVSVTLSEATTVLVTVNLVASGTATDDYTISGTQVVFEAGTTTASITVTAVDDEIDEQDETVIVDIASVTGGNEDGVQQQTITILDDDVPPSFVVTSLVSTASAVRVEFNNELDASDINLYDTQNAALGPADVVVTGASSGAVAGSLVIEASAVTFIKSGDPLGADTYTVTLRSAADGFKDTSAALLDGNGDGTAGDDYQSSFTIAAAPAGSRTIGIPDFVRGPGQDVNLPANETTGIPISISDGDDVRAVDLRIRYNPALFSITGATTPAGGSAVLNAATPGLAILVFFSPSSLPAGSGTFINLQATVPEENASEIYRSQELLDIHAVTVGDGNDNEFPVVVDDAFHLASYFADVSGNGRVNASDAAQVARFAALIDRGFAGSPNADPILAGDISGNGRINAADASRVAQFAALIEVPEIPPIPGGIRITGNPTATPEDLRPLVAAPHDLGTQSVVGDAPSVLTGGGITDSSSTTTFNVVQTFSSQGVETATIDALAVDAVMSDLTDARSGESDEEELTVALEDALAELLSAASEKAL